MSNWTRKEVLDKIQTIDPWKNSKTGERAPHKPLLILYAMGQLLCEGKKHIRVRSQAIPGNGEHANNGRVKKLPDGK
jgi:hypothetical protein